MTDSNKLSNPLPAGPWFNIKMSYQYRKSHCGDKAIIRSSYLHNWNSYAGETESLYWITPRLLWEKTIHICIFHHLLTLRWNIYLKSFLMEDKDEFILLTFDNNNSITIFIDLYSAEPQCSPALSGPYIYWWSSGKSKHQQPWYWPCSPRIFQL